MERKWLSRRHRLSGRNLLLAYGLSLALWGTPLSSWGQDALLNPMEQEMAAPEESVDDLLNMDLDQLANADVVVPALDTVVNSVSRQESTVGKSPAAIFVITSEMIQRSGARNLPDILRMVPGMHVARVNSNAWGVATRDTSTYFYARLLVQIDGRSVYNGIIGGVYWSMQDVVLEDIERIEVIRGPGASVWGSNAVHGIINITTKQAKDTQGLLVVGGAGTEERGFSTVRYGGQVGDDLHWRAYGKQFERDGGYNPSGPDFDDWRQAQGGFRMEWTPTKCDTFTFQGDFLEGTHGALQPTRTVASPYVAPNIGDIAARSKNSILRWTHQLDEDSDWALQYYYDDWEQNQPLYTNAQTTSDVDFQHRFLLGECHRMIWGLGYRHVKDHLGYPNPLDGFWSPDRLSTDLYSLFLQDEIELLSDQVYLTLGTKLEHNDFTGWEYQPTARLLYLPSERASAWLAISRAVRTPDRNFQHNHLDVVPYPGVPVVARFIGNDMVLAENLVAFEAGYRSQPNDDFFWDVTAFYKEYNNWIRFGNRGTPFFDSTIGMTVIPYVSGNVAWEDLYGIELASTYQVNPYWKLSGAVSLLYVNAFGRHTPGYDSEGLNSGEQVYLQSSWDISCNCQFDLMARYAGNLPSIGVSSYLTMDARFAWTPRERLEWAVVARNLLDRSHLEMVENFVASATEVEREVFTTLTWTY